MKTKLKVAYERDATCEEVGNLVFGTGALSYPWWVDVAIERDNEDIGLGAELTESDTLVITAWNPDEAEGVTKVYRVSPGAIVIAAGTCLSEGKIGNYSASDRMDIMTDSIGYCDAIEADVVLQMAAYGALVYS